MRAQLPFSLLSSLLVTSGYVSAKSSISMNVVAPNFVNAVDDLSLTATVKNTGNSHLRFLGRTWIYRLNQTFYDRGLTLDLARRIV